MIADMLKREADSDLEGARAKVWTEAAVWLHQYANAARQQTATSYGVVTRLDGCCMWLDQRRLETEDLALGEAFTALHDRLKAYTQGDNYRVTMRAYDDTSHSLAVRATTPTEAAQRARRLDRFYLVGTDVPSVEFVEVTSVAVMTLAGPRR
ncbi:hypothetical protein [Kutzneria sp. 744]|uniref:hypothetical protein n=1 Tax=Kutzneria sp. (strain 744) TaxID=345341 RepID=UPI001E4B2D43|nr:hypothetical protein [Kutzneria sp. 744]